MKSNNLFVYLFMIFSLREILQVLRDILNIM